MPPTTAAPLPAGVFRLALADQGTTRTLTAAGELDIASAADLREAAAAALGTPCETLVVDLGQATFIDSSGVHALVDLDARCRRAGARLVVLPAPDGVHDVFELCGLGERLPFVPRARADLHVRP